MNIAEIVQIIERAFPQSAAQDWDNVGLLVGDAQQELTGVVCALDPSLEALAYCTEQGANCLITHHPAFISPLHSVVPTTAYEQRIAYEAIKRNVSLIAAHTNLDASIEALELPARLTGFTLAGPLEVQHLGSLLNTQGLSVANIAQRFEKAYGCDARIAGNRESIPHRVAFISGSASSLVAQLYQKSIDCLITGEMSYHAAAALIARQCALILLGHDASELPYATLFSALLAHESIEASVFKQPILFANNSVRRPS